VPEEGAGTAVLAQARTHGAGRAVTHWPGRPVRSWRTGEGWIRGILCGRASFQGAVRPIASRVVESVSYRFSSLNALTSSAKSPAMSGSAVLTSYSRVARRCRDIRDPLTIGPNATVGEEMDRLLDGGFRHLPVMEGGTLVGIVSMRDLARSISKG
jgi:hypothetical protein